MASEISALLLSAQTSTSRFPDSFSNTSASFDLAVFKSPPVVVDSERGYVRILQDQLADF